MNRKITGDRGEALAADFLRESGYRILERNFRTKRGEIDIIAAQGDCIVFVEVKHWKTYGSADLEYGIDGRKQSRIIGVSREYLAGLQKSDTASVRYDVVFIGSKEEVFDHYINAFTETGTV